MITGLLTAYMSFLLSGCGQKKKPRGVEGEDYNSIRFYQNFVTEDWETEIQNNPSFPKKMYNSSSGKKMDTNKNGKIEKEEYIEKAMEFFNDTNKDGYVTNEEIEKNLSEKHGNDIQNFT